MNTTYKLTSEPWFSFDDLPLDKWRDKLHEFDAWIDLEMLRPDSTIQEILAEFISRMTGNLQEWFQGFSEYQKIQVLCLHSLG